MILSSPAGRVSLASFVEVARNALTSVRNIFFWDDAILNIVPVATIYIDLDPVLDIVIFFKFIRMDAEVVDLVAIILVGINLTIVSAFQRLCGDGYLLHLLARGMPCDQLSWL